MFVGPGITCVFSHPLPPPCSVIPAFCKRGDVIVTDEAVNFAIQSGCSLSRSRVYYYRHNDMSDLERVLQQASP